MLPFRRFIGRCRISPCRYALLAAQGACGRKVPLKAAAWCFSSAQAGEHSSHRLASHAVFHFLVFPVAFCQAMTCTRSRRRKKLPPQWPSWRRRGRYNIYSFIWLNCDAPVIFLGLEGVGRPRVLPRRGPLQGCTVPRIVHPFSLWPRHLVSFLFMYRARPGPRRKGASSCANRRCVKQKAEGSAWLNRLSLVTKT